MKALISKNNLQSLVGKIQNIISPRPALPILANLLIEAVDDQLIFSATDLTVSMRAFVEAKVIEEGAITLPARLFFNLIREIIVPEVELHSTAPDMAFLNAGSSHFKIHGMHKEEFPALPDLSDGLHFSLASPALKEMLMRTGFAAARDDSRQVLNGVFMHMAGGTISCVATNGKCIAHVQSPANLPSEQTSSCILPIKAVEELIKILDAKEGEAKITIMPDKFAVDVGSVVLITKLLNGPYPDVLRVIPENKSATVSLHREELVSLLRQVSLFTSENSNSVRLSFSPGELHLSSMTGSVGEGKVNMPVNFSGPKLEIAFNPHHFLDILRHTKDETITLDLFDSFNPGVVTDSTSARFAMMPMRL